MEIAAMDLRGECIQSLLLYLELVCQIIFFQVFRFSTMI